MSSVDRLISARHECFGRYHPSRRLSGEVIVPYEILHTLTSRLIMLEITSRPGE
jgi:hypothetical protein